MVQSRTAWCAFQSPHLTHRTAVRAVIIAYADKHGPIPNGGHRSSRLASVVQPDRFCTTHVRASALNALRWRAHLEVLGASPDEPKTEPGGSIMSQMGTETPSDTTKGEVMGKLEGKVAVITG